MKALVVILLFLITPPTQNTNVWQTLSMVNVENNVFDPNLGYAQPKITISPIIKAMDGKEIEISGYIIPLSGKKAQPHFMLSRYPESMCFFCGAAGPESAMQVFMKDKKKVAYSKEKIKVKGTLRVNAVDAANLIYTLNNAVTVK